MKLAENTLGAMEKLFNDSLIDRYESNEVQAIFRHTVGFFFDFSPADIVLGRQQRLSESEILRLDKVLEGLTTGKPLQYLLGEVPFSDLTFKVNESVLIPRPETEELVLWVTNHLKEHYAEGALVLDLGTGSGCIASSIKSGHPKSVVTGIDVSLDALNLAVSNAALNGLEVDFKQADILDGVEKELPGPYDVMVSNPPYVPEKDKKTMEANVLEHEPHLALFVPDNDPLLFYSRILDYAESGLKPGGWLFFEIHSALGPAMVRLLEGREIYQNLALQADIDGKDRMICAQKRTLIQ